MVTLSTPRLFAASLSSANGSAWALITSPNAVLGYTAKVICLSATSNDTVPRTLQLGVARVAVVSITIGTPGVFSWPGHNFTANEQVWFTTTGALPGGITAGPTYYVISPNIAAGTFQIATTAGGSAINTTGSQSGNHTGYVVRVRNTVIVPANAGTGGAVPPTPLLPGVGANTLVNTWALTMQGVSTTSTPPDDLVGSVTSQAPSNLASDNAPYLLIEVGDYLAVSATTTITANKLISIQGEAYTNESPALPGSAYASIIP